MNCRYGLIRSKLRKYTFIRKFFFEGCQRGLDARARCKAAERAVGGAHAVAGEEYKEGIGPHGSARSAEAAGVSGLARKFGVAAAFTVGYRSHSGADGQGEVASGVNEGQAEMAEASRKIEIELADGFVKERVGLVLRQFPVYAQEQSPRVLAVVSIGCK